MMRAAEGSVARDHRRRTVDSARVGRVRFFALGDRRLASSRLRAWQLADELGARGVLVRTVVGPSIRGLIALLARSDVTVVQKWTPPAVVMALLRATSRVLVFDVDDAIYLEGTGRRGRINDRNRRRLRASLGLYDAVTTSTPVIADDLQAMRTGLPVLVYPGPIDVRSTSDTASRSGALWLGSAATEGYLAAWKDDLLAIDAEMGFIAVGATARTAELGLSVVEWSPEAEREALARCAVGILVQPRGAWENRKSAYKVLEYVAAGVVPVAERLPATEAILGADYPYLVDAQDLSANALYAARMPVEDRRSLLDGLVDRISAYSYPTVSVAWLEFTEALRA